MRTRLPPNVTREKTRHGIWVTYFRIGKGKRTRLPDFGVPEFEEAYQAARIGKPLKRKSVRGAEGTLGWLVTEYKKSLHFRSLDPVTQRRRDSFFKQMVDASGDAMIADIIEQDIVDAREDRTAGRGHAANNFLKAVRPMFAYARQRGWIAVDPTRNVDNVKTQKGGRTVWGIEDYRRFEQRHPLGTMANLAVRLLLFTGLRRSDAIKLGRQHIRNGVVRHRPGKTEKSSDVVATFTALPPLLEAIAATRTGDLAFLATERGEPFASGASFGNWFADRCAEAEVSGRAHGLRKLGPTLAAEFGASAHELMAMWGWVTLEQAELYTKSANRERLGASAATKLQAGYDELIANNIPRTFDEGAGIERKTQ